LDLTSKFSFGVNIDDSWRYAGFPEPRSIIIPHLLSVSLPEGRFRDRIDDAEILAHREGLPQKIGARASLALADAMEDVRADFVRCWFAWSFFEPKPVPASDVQKMADTGYKAYPMDSFVDTLTDRGIGVIPVLACGYKRMLPKGLSVDSDPTLYLRRAYAHARLVVRRYKGKVKYWQIENEPDWWTEHEAAGWRSGASWVSKTFRNDLLRLLSEAVHEEDPSARAIINLEADRPITNIGEYSANCDMVGLDFYPNYKAADPIDVGRFKQATEYAKRAGKPTFIAETGYPSGPLLLGYSQQKQARYIEAACRESFALDSVNAVGIWRYIDTAWKSFPDQENHFGMIDAKGGPKESWTKFGSVVRELKG